MYCKVSLLFTIDTLKDGHKISPGFAIAYLLYTKKITLTVASLKVF